MLQSIVNGITSVVCSIGSLINFIIDFFSDLVFVITTLGNFIIKIPAYFIWLPTSLIVVLFTLSLLSLCIKFWVGHKYG